MEIRVTPTPDSLRWLEENGMSVGVLCELGNPLVEICEPGRPPRRFIPVQGGLIAPEDQPRLITLE